MSLNRITIMGRLTKDPELRYTQQNTAVTSFTVACDRDYQSGGSERQTDFIECAAWKHTAEFVSKYFTKGQLAVVSGRLQSRKWKDKDGRDRISWEVLADSVYFAEKKQDTAATQGRNVEPPKFEELDEDGELPF